MFDHRRLLLEVQVDSEKSTGSFDCSVTRCLNTLQDSFPSLSSKLPIEALRNTVFQIRTLQHGHRTIREIGSQKFALLEKTSNKNNVTLFSVYVREIKFRPLFLVNITPYL